MVTGKCMFETNLKKKLLEDKIELTKRQYVTFALDHELYGIDVKKVQEVLNLFSIENIARVPNSLKFMKGVIDLRGKIVPIIDLRIKFNIAETEYNNKTVVIIIDLRNILFGLIVDSVFDVISMTIDEIQNTPHFALDINSDAVIGIYKKNERLVIILDVDNLINEDEYQGIKNI